MSYRNEAGLFVLVVLAASAFAACGEESSGADQDGEIEYELVWSDEFDGPEGQLPDDAYWNFDVGTGPNGDGWGNNQLEYDTARPDNASLDGNGNLVITAREESFQGRSYTSARILTQGKVAYQYGRIEARIALPEGQGIWPAFWMLGSNITRVGWPQCGEIDIMEYRGQEPAIVSGALHGPGYSGGSPINNEAAISGGLAGNFRVFAVEWEPGSIRWLVDDFEYHRVTPADLPPGSAWVFDQPFFIILNVAVGGWFAGNPDETTEFPQTMRVDYVRVYQQAEQ